MLKINESIETIIDFRRLSTIIDFLEKNESHWLLCMWYELEHKNKAFYRSNKK